jgi:hypothetical protein
VRYGPTIDNPLPLPEVVEQVQMADAGTDLARGAS